MKQTFKRIGLLVFVTAALVVPAGHASASTNDFSISNFQIDYHLSKDSEQHSKLKTVETIDAVFPDFDQNHGIERAIPKEYKGHSTRLTINSVTDGSGNSRTYKTYSSGDSEVVRIGDADTYVHGLQSYTITYTQQDVTNFFPDTNDDEFYWDTNGIGWAQPINTLGVRVHVDSALRASLTNKNKCYVGREGSTTPCDVQTIDDGFSVQASGLSAYENVSIALGFKPHTFATYKASLSDMLSLLFVALLFITPFLAAVVSIWYLIRYNRQSKRTAEHTSIVPEYIPPKDTSVTAAASIYRSGLPSFTAQLIDFAVRGYTKIYQTREKSFFRNAEYEIEIIKDISDLKNEERELLTDIFPTTVVGTRLAMSDLKKRRYQISANLRDNKKKLDTDIKGQYGLRAKNAEESAWFKRAGFITLIVAVVLFSPWMLGAAIMAFILSYMLAPYTDKGLALYHYMEGLKLYIKTAEVDRIRMLQSPEGAEKLDAPIDTNDPRQLVKLYERVLPYAILFGLEKDWNKQLGQYYETLNASPNWYQGSGSNTVFNAAVFSSAISSFNSIASTSSASSGGTGGGGSSGGGGGGGGGGGW